MFARAAVVFAMFCVALLPAAAGAADNVVKLHVDPHTSADPVAEFHARSVTRRSAGETLPTTWCGTPTDIDRIAGNPDKPNIKFVYAYPADQPNRFERYADTIQADAVAAQQYLADQAEHRKTMRYDMGTDCGPEYLDIQTIQLPDDRADYVKLGNIQAMTRIYHQAGQMLNGTPVVDFSMNKVVQPARNFLVYIDGAHAGEGAAGAANVRNDDRPGPENTSNNGDEVAMVMADDAIADPPGTQLRAGTVMHELGHSLGAVQYTAPHSTSGGKITAGNRHCYDEYDIMCYDDGGPTAELTFPCGAAASWILSDTFDCGHDDYFAVDPAPGSYLATHWNLYNSVFLGTCLELAPACERSLSLMPPPPAPEPTPEPTPSPTPEPTPKPSKTVRPGPKHIVFHWKRNGADVSTRMHASSFDAGRRANVKAFAGGPRVPAGRWRIEICVDAPGLAPAKSYWCNTRRARVHRSRRLRVYPLDVDMPITRDVFITGDVTGRPFKGRGKKRRLGRERTWLSAESRLLVDR